jgi:hypothetical protein
MILSLSEISTVGSSFEEDVGAYAAAGFDAIGLCEFKLPSDDNANATLLHKHGLRVATYTTALTASSRARASRGLESSSTRLPLRDGTGHSTSKSSRPRSCSGACPSLKQPNRHTQPRRSYARRIRRA